MVDEELKSKIVEKIDEGILSPDDIMDYLELLLQICNENEEIQEEVEDWNRTFQCIIKGAEDFWLKIDKQRFSGSKGTVEDPDITLEFDAETAIGIFSGEIDAVARTS